MKSLFILGASEIQVPVIRECKRLGHRAVVADYNADAPGMRIADVSLAISTNDISAILAAAQQYAIDGILTTSDYPVRTVARVCRELGLHGLPEDAATISTDKYLQRELLRSNGFCCPRFFRIAQPEALSLVPAHVPFPMIIKPVDSSASRGVSRVDDLSRLDAAYTLARSFSRNGSVIAEEFVSGREFSVEVLIQNSRVEIIAITEKSTGGDGYLFFVEEQHIVPASVTEIEANAIRDTVRRAVIAAGLNDCASHTEVKLSSSGPVIIEIAARLGGDFITSDLVPLATGVSMLENVLRIALGEEIKTRQQWSRFAGIRFVTPETHERAKSHFELICNDPRVCGLEMHEKPDGATLRSSLDRLGHCIAVGNTRQELLAILEF